MNYYVEQNGKILLFDTDKEKIQNTLMFMPDSEGLEIKETERPITQLEDTSFVFADTPEYEEEKIAKEKARILELSMTRSDFFDGTIKAFGADESDLFTGIGQVLTPMGISDVEKKIALNNYQNALNFYRKHPLFTMLSDIPIPISEDVTITISSEQWDRFFDETNKRNPDAYKELLPKYTLEIAATPSDSIVEINGQELNSIVAIYGTIINYKVSKTGYISKSDTVILDKDITLSVELEPEQEEEIIQTE